MIIWQPETDEEWNQLDAYRMAQQDTRLPFRYVVLLCLAVAASVRLWVFPMWDQQQNDFFQQQKALEQACEKSGGVPTEAGCKGLRKRGQ